MVALRTLNPGLPETVLQQIAGAGVCLPGGKIYDSTNSTGSSLFPPGTVVVADNKATTLPGDLWAVTPAPVDTCGNALPPIDPLSASSATGVGNSKLQSALRGIGALSSCAGDYYHYTILSPAHQEKLRLNAYYFNKDYYGTIYQDFVTGPPDAGSVVTHGTFGVENVTGPGHFVATGAWKGSSENHNGEVNCLDSWTLLPVKIPVAGLTPFPDDVTSQENWAEHVVATPVTMSTLGQGSASATVADLQASYDAAYEKMGVKVAGQYTQGMINSDPLRMLKSDNASQVTAAVTVLAANAQALGALTVARALAECNGTPMSNELYAKAAYRTHTTVPTSLQEDLLTITRVARVVQSDLYDSTKQCCSSTPQSASPFTQYTSNLDEVLSSAPVNQTAVLETGSYPAATPSTAIKLMTGHLLNSAGVKNCVVSGHSLCVALCAVNAMQCCSWHQQRQQSITTNHSCNCPAAGEVCRAPCSAGYPGHHNRLLRRLQCGQSCGGWLHL
ncbi:hypothetical protein COO60DRAFT_711727 [Scenedesmus sp. NREL 46B-D3]|nr:hypothetical protein COO60DRAFT_711727 [Scenedesmus sp. NREL 46B-D3]